MPIIHIALINDTFKNYIINKFNNKNHINIIDLDKYMIQILIKSESYQLYKEEYKIKGLKMKQFEKNYIFELRDNLYQYFEKLENDNKYNIVIGYNIFFNNISSYCNFNFNLKFFHYLNDKNIILQNIDFLYDNKNIDNIIQNIISNNINYFNDDIIKGYIPINFLNYQDINKKFCKYVEYLDNEDYIFINNIDEIIKIINKKIAIENPNKLYFASFSYFGSTQSLGKECDNIIKNDIIYAYSEIWIALISLFGNKITKGINNKKPFIGDLNNCIENNIKKIYLYEIIETEYYIPLINDKHIYKYYIHKYTFYNNFIIIENLEKFLNEQNINIIKFNSNNKLI